MQYVNSINHALKRNEKYGLKGNKPTQKKRLFSKL